MTFMTNLESRALAVIGAVVLFGLPATAAPPAPKRAVSIGSAKEEDLERPVFKANRDLALMRAMLSAFEPSPVEIRCTAVEDLGLLGDARALNPLAQLVLDYNPRIAGAAIRAVSLIRHPRAEEILSNVIRHPTLAEALKVQAATLLAYQNTDTAIRFLKTVERTSGWPLAVQQRVHLVLQDVPSGRGGMP